MQPGLELEPMPTGAGAAIGVQSRDLMGMIWPCHCFFFLKFLEPQSSLSGTVLGLLMQSGKAQICS